MQWQTCRLPNIASGFDKQTAKSQRCVLCLALREAANLLRSCFNVRIGDLPTGLHPNQAKTNAELCDVKFEYSRVSASGILTPPTLILSSERSARARFLVLPTPTRSNSRQWATHTVSSLYSTTRIGNLIPEDVGSLLPRQSKIPDQTLNKRDIHRRNTASVKGDLTQATGMTTRTKCRSLGFSPGTNFSSPLKSPVFFYGRGRAGMLGLH